MSFQIRSAALAVLLTPLVGAPLAQSQRASIPSVAAPASGAASTAFGYRSVFDSYRGYSEQPVLSWREANDVVGRIGGWQAYAREGQGGAAASQKEPGPAKPANQPATPASGTQPGGHTGHKMP